MFYLIEERARALVFESNDKNCTFRSGSASIINQRVENNSRLFRRRRDCNEHERKRARANLVIVINFSGPINFLAHQHVDRNKRARRFIQKFATPRERVGVVVESPADDVCFRILRISLRRKWSRRCENTFIVL